MATAENWTVPTGISSKSPVHSPSLSAREFQMSPVIPGQPLSTPVMVTTTRSTPFDNAAVVALIWTLPFCCAGLPQASAPMAARTQAALT
jgi:hypothetical protein